MLLSGLCHILIIAWYPTAAKTVVDLRESMLGIGSAWFLLAVLPSAALGLAGRSRKTARETEVRQGWFFLGFRV